MDDVTRIWNGSPSDALQQVPPLIEARSVAEFRAAAAFWQQAVLERQEQQLDDKLQALRAEGIILPGLAPDWRERLGAFWDNLVARFQPSGPENGQAAELLLIATYPTDELNFDYEQIDAEIARFRDQVATLITAAHGCPPPKPVLPPEAYDVFYDEDPGEAAYDLMEIQFITACWPPAPGRPGLAISDRQEDGGLPREISLQARDAAAHAQIEETLRQFGGRLE